MRQNGATGSLFQELCSSEVELIVGLLQNNIGTIINNISISILKW